MAQHKRGRANDAPPSADGMSRGPQTVDSEAIARRAFELYQHRGREDGRDWEDWFQAEQETRAQRRESSG